MTMELAPQHVTDRPVYLETAGGHLAGMWSDPAMPEEATGVVVLSAGGHTVHSQANRWGYRVARSLAAEGFRVLRLDYLGIGDSSGVAETFALDSPNVGDARAAIAAMLEHVDSVLVIGHCYGARSAFEVAADLPSVKAIYAVAPPVRDGARGEGTGNRMAYDSSLAGYMGHAAKAVKLDELRSREGRRRYARLARTFARARWQRVRSRLPGAQKDPTPWVSPRLLEQLDALTARATGVFFAYGSDDSDYADFSQAREGRLGQIVSRGKGVEVSVRDGEVHNMSRVSLQNEMIDEMVRWVLGQARATTTGGAAE